MAAEPEQPIREAQQLDVLRQKVRVLLGDDVVASAEAAAMKGGKSALARLEQRVRELEAELGGIQGRTGEMMKGNQRAERKVKELQFAQDEDKKNQDR